ncbi:MAG: hypothetical protein JWR16_1221 [Nevskia sp.]|nr:hypothetical protein [Nevskia sp.]
MHDFFQIAQINASVAKCKWGTIAIHGEPEPIRLLIRVMHLCNELLYRI